MRVEERRAFGRISSVAFGLALAAASGLLVPAGAAAQGPGTEDGGWTYLGGDAWHTRYTTADQLDPSNFEQLEVIWQWNATSFGPATARATPSLVGGKLITVAGNRRHVVALDPATGELLWSFREPNTYRYEYSMRKGYGKGVAYTEIDGRGVVFITSPGFFLHALDADTGLPLEGWGRPVPLDGFGDTGAVDLVEDLIADWGPWTSMDRPYDPYIGIPSGDRLHHRVVAPHRRQRHRGRRQLGRAGLPADPGRERARRHPRLRRAHRRLQVEVPRDSPARRVRARDLGERRLAVDRRRVVVGPDVRRPRARARLHRHQRRHHRLLRRSPPRRQPVQHEHHRAGRRDRGTALALPDGPPRHLELRHPDGAGPDGRDRRRAGDQGGLPGHQAGLPLRARSRDRRAHLAHRGAPRPGVQHPRRGALRDPAVPDPARPLRPAGPDRGPPDRLHARDQGDGAPGGGGEQPLQRAVRPADPTPPTPRGRRGTARAAVAAPTSPGRPSGTRSPASCS